LSAVARVRPKAAPGGPDIFRGKPSRVRYAYPNYACRTPEGFVKFQAPVTEVMKGIRWHRL